MKIHSLDEDGGGGGGGGDVIQTYLRSIWKEELGLVSGLDIKSERVTSST